MMILVCIFTYTDDNHLIKFDIFNFSEYFLEIVIIFKLIVMIVEIHFILLVVNGIHIIIHNVIWYNYLYKYYFTVILINIKLSTKFKSYRF